MPTDVGALIDRYARRYRIDPRAARAVARTEGGLRFGAVGDQGTSFGPFQLHEGGALPRGRGAAWANSPAGVEYAIRKMAEAGAAGLTGRQAIESIVRQFERPADPARSIARALGFYGAMPQAGQGAATATGPVATTLEQPEPEVPGRTPRQAALLAGLLADDDPELVSVLTERLTPKQPDMEAAVRVRQPSSRPKKAPAIKRFSGGLLAQSIGGVPFKDLGGPSAHHARALGNWQSDNAWDIGIPAGTPVYAVADGVIGPKVGAMASRPGDGQRLTLEGKGNEFWYGHLSRIAVRAGQRVRRGQLLGYSGASRNGVEHLHLGVKHL